MNQPNLRFLTALSILMATTNDEGEIIKEDTLSVAPGEVAFGELIDEGDCYTIIFADGSVATEIPKLAVQELPTVETVRESLDAVIPEDTLLAQPESIIEREALAMLPPITVLRGEESMEDFIEKARAELAQHQQPEQ